MFKNFWASFKPQDLSDREAQTSFRILQAVVLISLLGALGTLAAVFTFAATPHAQAIVIFMNVLLLANFILLRQRILLPARVMAPLALFTTVVFLMMTGSGVHDISIVAFGGIVILASLTLGRRAAFVFAGLTIVAVFGVAFAEMNGLLNTDASYLTTPDDPVLITIVILAIAFTQNVMIGRLNLSIQEARENEKAQAEANRELTELKNALEKRVEERTAELARRASQLETVSTVARSITSVQDLDRLLPSIAAVVSQQFGFYHTGIFLLDDQAEYAVLQASNSPGGQRMLRRGHRLRVGATGIVGFVAAHGEPRIALDVGADAVFFNNPDLPATRSEAALPLKIGGQTIGVLDAQSEEVDAFQPEDINILSILANQITVAIENARLFSQTRQALEESKAVYEQYVKQDWARFSRQTRSMGYTYDGIRIAPVDSPPGEPDAQTLRVPVKIRGLVVGFVNVRANDPLRQWTDDELRLVQSAAERAGLAIENVRLLNEAQRRASKERTIGEISSKIGASIKMESIMQTAVEELGRALPGSEVILQFREEG